MPPLSNRVFGIPVNEEPRYVVPTLVSSPFLRDFRLTRYFTFDAMLKPVLMEDRVRWFNKIKLAAEV